MYRSAIPSTQWMAIQVENKIHILSYFYKYLRPKSNKIRSIWIYEWANREKSMVVDINSYE